MIWILSILLISQWVWSIKLAYERNAYRESAKTLAAEVVKFRAQQIEALKEKPLTASKPKMQDKPKQLSGPQLRRMAEHVNTETMASLQERPNSEILQEQENG